MYASAFSNASADYALEAGLGNFELDPTSYIERWPEMRASRAIWISVGSVFLACALIGHSLSIGAVLSSRRMRAQAICVHLVANAVSGLLAATTGLLRDVVLYATNHRVDVRGRPYGSPASCRAHVFFTYFSLQLHAWVQVSVSAERLVAVRAPMSYRRWCSRPHALVVIAVVAVVLGVLNAFVAAIHDHSDREGRCKVQENVWLFENVWGYLDLVLYSLLPAAIILPCNVATVMALRDQSRHICTSSASSAKSRPITVMLLTVNAVFLITTMPISVIFLVQWPHDVESRENAQYDLTWTIFSVVQYGGSSVSFLVYCTMATRFRRAVKAVLSCSEPDDSTVSIPRVSSKVTPVSDLQLEGIEQEARANGNYPSAPI